MDLGGGVVSGWDGEAHVRCWSVLKFNWLATVVAVACEE